MTYMGDNAFWEASFQSRGDKPLEAEASIQKYSELFKQGTLLDLACGDGRNSLYLSEKGYDVTGVDFSDTALERLQGFAETKNMSIETVKKDLSMASTMSELAIYDNIIVSHYKLDETQLMHLKDHIRPDGILLITGFGHKADINQRIATKDLLYKDDFLILKDTFELINYEESIDGRGFFSTYVFQKR